MLPLSLLNDFLYCPRRAALKIVEGWRGENEHTARGDIVHEHADEPGYEVAKGVTLLRALPVFSEQLGLSGKCDIVEVHPVAAEVTRLTLSRSKNRSEKSESESEPSHVGSYNNLVPVEFKKSRRREFTNDDVQLCAQALCLEEMFQCHVKQGAVFHAASKRRRRVEFDTALRFQTQQAVTDLREMLRQSEIANCKSEIPSLPPARYIEGRCEECSLFDVCLPRVTRAEAENRNTRQARRLFET